MDTPQPFDHHVFINYAREDRASAQKLKEELVEAGFRVWFDDSALQGGEEWENKIRSAIAGSRYFLSVLSSHSVGKAGYVKKEIEMALDHAKRRRAERFLLPVRLEKCKSPFPQIERLNWIDLWPSRFWDSGVRRVMRVLREPQVFGKDPEIIGFDLGHGESAVTRTTLYSRAKPQVLEILSGRTSILTAFALDPEEGLLIGNEAYRSPNPGQMVILFKSNRFNRPEVSGAILLFVRECLKILKQDGKATLGEDTRFFVGCPSGWTDEDRKIYESVLQEAGMAQVSVRPESRAAFLEAKESGELTGAFQKLADSVLIVDIGSSTSDFTMVNNWKETPLDFGHNLGCGLIDVLILNRALEAYGEKREQLEQFLVEHPPARSRCLLLCRDVKEAYFSKDEQNWIERPASGHEKLDRGLFFELELGHQDMQAILATPIPQLGDALGRRRSGKKF